MGHATEHPRILSSSSAVAGRAPFINQCSDNLDLICYELAAHSAEDCRLAVACRAARRFEI